MKLFVPSKKSLYDNSPKSLIAFFVAWKAEILEPLGAEKSLECFLTDSGNLLRRPSSCGWSIKMMMMTTWKLFRQHQHTLAPAACSTPLPRLGNGAYTYDKPPAKPNVAHTSRCTKAWGGEHRERGSLEGEWLQDETERRRGMTSHWVQVACPYRLASNFKALSSALNYNNTATAAATATAVATSRVEPKQQ